MFGLVSFYQLGTNPPFCFLYTPFIVVQHQNVFIPFVRTIKFVIQVTTFLFLLILENPFFMSYSTTLLGGYIFIFILHF